MKITNLETFCIHNENRNWIYVKINTNEGIEGVGEAYSMGPDEATVAAIRYFGDWLSGRNPKDIENLLQIMYNFSRFPGGSIVNSAISGIEIALWDILGKSCGLPIYTLLGGRFRKKVRVYTHIKGVTTEELVRDAVKVVKKGYTALKMSAYPPHSHRMKRQRLYQEVKERAEAVRTAIGNNVDICFDAHAKTFETTEAALICKAVEEVKPLFLEEPLRPENIDALRKLCSNVNIPIATGEQLYTKFQFRELLEKQAADIIQPDICCAGGLLEVKKIAAMAEAYFIPVALHNPLSLLATSANLHIATTIPNFLILEYMPKNECHKPKVIKEQPKVKDGYITPSPKPGLGIKLNLDVISENNSRTWHRDFSFKDDGSPALI